MFPCFNDKYNAMVIGVFEDTLEKLYGRVVGPFSRKTLCEIASQMLKRLEYAHNCGVVVQDVKPENIGYIKSTVILFGN